VIFFLENNLYGMGTHVDRTHAAGRDIFKVADHYKIPAVQIDGMDLMAVRQATAEATERIRDVGGPVFLEAMTYRYRGHSMADPVAYRETTEVDEWRVSDPIERFKAFARGEGLISDDEFAEIDAGVDTTIEDAVQFALNSPEPDMDTLFDNIYS